MHWITNSKPNTNSNGLSQLQSAPNVQHWKRTRLTSVEGDDSGVTSVKVQESGSQEDSILNVNGVFVYSSGSLPITDYLHGQIPLTEEGGVQVNDDMMTDLDGVWAIGDIRNTPFKQAVVACSDGCIAAMSIDKFLNQRKEIRVDWVHR